jgi:hypothetical protein
MRFPIFKRSKQVYVHSGTDQGLAEENSGSY